MGEGSRWTLLPGRVAGSPSDSRSRTGRARSPLGAPRHKSGFTPDTLDRLPGCLGNLRASILRQWFKPFQHLGIPDQAQEKGGIAPAIGVLVAEEGNQIGTGASRQLGAVSPDLL